MDPVSLKKRFTVLLQEFFRQDKDFRYSDSQSDTGIIITDIYGVDREAAGNYPLIAVERLEMAVDRVGVGSVGSASALKTLAKDGPHVKYGNIINAGVTCHCLSTVGVESEIIATKVANFLEMTRSEIKPLARLLRLDSVTMGKERRLDKWPDHVDTPVSVSCMYPSVWKITDLDTIIHKAGVEFGKFDQSFFDEI